MYFSTILKALKMIYQLFWFLTTCLTFLFNALWLCCNFASVGIPWLMLLFFLVCIASKFVKLRCPASDIVQSMLHRSEKGVGSEVLYWPIVSRGGAFDAPENSLAAINHVWVISIVSAMWHSLISFGVKLICIVLVFVAEMLQYITWSQHHKRWTPGGAE